MATSPDPLIDNGLTKGSENFPGEKLHFHRPSQKVEVTITSNVLHNHSCGCSKCWKLVDAIFSIVGSVLIENVKVTANNGKLAIVDQSATVQRHACKECGVDIFGRIEKAYAFKGLDFIHVKLSDDREWQEPQFAAFVSSVIEQGFDPKGIDAVRSKFKSLGLETYDFLSPVLIDLMSAFTASQSWNCG